MRLIQLIAAMAVVMFAGLPIASTQADVPPPWEVPNDVNFAINKPDLYA